MSGTETLFTVRRMDHIVASFDKRPSIRDPLELAVFDQKYFHLFPPPNSLSCKPALRMCTLEHFLG